MKGAQHPGFPKGLVPLVGAGHFAQQNERRRVRDTSRTALRSSVTTSAPARRRRPSARQSRQVCEANLTVAKLSLPCIHTQVRVANQARCHTPSLATPPLLRPKVALIYRCKREAKQLNQQKRQMLQQSTCLFCIKLIKELLQPAHLPYAHTGRRAPCPPSSAPCIGKHHVWR